MSKIIAAIAIALVIAIIAGLSLLGMYNGMVAQKLAVEKSWNDVEAGYQMRLDTIPNFVKTAKFSTEFQLKLAKDYAQAREGLDKAGSSRDPNTLEKAANDGMTALVVAVRAEAVPEAKTEQLTELNAEIDSVERVIRHNRVAYNDAIKQYDTAIETIPGKWFAAGWGFYPMEGFKAQQGAEKTPEWELDFK